MSAWRFLRGLSAVVPSSFVVRLCFVVVPAGAMLAATAASAADPEFVGVLALAVEKDGAAQLKLTDDQRAKLLALVERRESEVLELALALRGATLAEREAKLAPFRQASEAAGLKLLDDAQRALLERLRVRRAGGASLVEPSIAERLQLSPEQTAALAKLAAERQEQLARASGQEREVLRNAFEQRMFAVLGPEQRARWEAAAGVATATAAKVAAAQPAAAAPAPSAGIGAAPGVASSSEARAATTAAPTDPSQVRLKFNFRFQPWSDVLDWFAQQADLSLLMDAPPPGTLNYTDPRSYTPAEALDLMNGILLTKGYTLVRRERMLLVVNLEDGIPPNLVAFVPADKLDSLGEFELVTTLFSVSGITPEDAETEIKKLIGPQGAVVALPKARQLQVTETAGRLRLMRSVLQASAGLQTGGGDIRAFQPVHVTVEDALPLVRQLLNIPPDAYADSDGSIRLAVDPLTGKLLVGGKPERVGQVVEIMKAVDVPAPELTGPGFEQPQLEVYDVGAADPASALAVLQTLLANYADVRLTSDPQTGKLVALARPAQHATIRAVLDQMQREARQFEVLRLQFVDPQQAVLAINRLFGGGETASAGAPKVEADLSTRQLLVRGSPTQIEQIRSLLTKMGENVAEGAASEPDTSTVRMLPLGSRTVRQALEQMDAVWPTLRPNKIRVVTPSSTIEAIHPAAADRRAPETNQPSVPTPSARPPAAPDTGPKVPPPAHPASPTTPAAGERSAVRAVRVHTASLSMQAPAAAAPVESPANAAEPPPIIVAPGAAGVMIASDDVEALDQFEALLNSLASRALTGGKEFTVFYLENASAAAAAESLEAVFGAGGAGGGSLLGDLAGMALGNVGGGLVGAMMGGGAPGPTASITGSSSVLIVPDARLNALIVQASPADLDLMEQLLRVIDRVDVPESTVNPRPRLIPVRNTGAAQVAEILREVYQDKLVNVNRQRQPSPEEMIQLLRGGGGRGGSSGGRRTATEGQKVAIGVDARTNSLVVSAAEPLFGEIEQLVQTLDQATGGSTQAVRVVTLKRSNAATVQKALTAIVGDKATSSTKPAADAAAAAAASAPSPGSQSSGGNPLGDLRQMQDLMRQRMEMFNQMRSGFGRGDGGRGDGGRDGNRDGGRDGDRDGRR